MDKMKPWLLIVVFCWAGCSTEDVATAPDNDAAAADNDAAAVDDSGASADRDAGSLRECSPERSDEPSRLADRGFDVAGTSLCGDLADDGAAQAVVRSASESEVVVEVGSTQVTFGGWQGPALDGLFSADETVDVVLPCASSWSTIEGSNASVVALGETPAQYWNQPVDLPALPETLSLRPELRLEPICQQGRRFYNGLKATAPADEVVEWTSPATKEVYGWQINFGGSQWCCRAGDAPGGEAPETVTQLNLYRQF